MLFILSFKDTLFPSLPFFIPSVPSPSSCIYLFPLSFRVSKNPFSIPLRVPFSCVIAFLVKEEKMEIKKQSHDQDVD